MANLGLEYACRQRGPQHDAEVPDDHPLRHRIADRWKHRCEEHHRCRAHVLDVPHQPHHRYPRPLSQAKPPAQRIAVRPKAARSGLIDNRHPRFAVLIVFGEESAADKRRLHHLEVIGAHQDVLRAQFVFGRRGTIFNRQAEGKCITAAGRSETNPASSTPRIALMRRCSSR
jgi:hypothetical protein